MITSRTARRGNKAAALFVAPVIVAFAFASWINQAPLLRAMADLWVVSETPQEADAIVVLGGGINTRPFVAAELYKAGVAKKILTPAIKPSRLERAEFAAAPVERDVLIKLGVPHEAITSVGHDVTNTFQEMQAVRGWVEQSGAKKIIVVTEFFSSRRTRWVFVKGLSATGATVIVHAVEPPDYQFETWWQHERGVIDFQNEVLKYLYYRIKY